MIDCYVRSLEATELERRVRIGKDYNFIFPGLASSEHCYSSQSIGLNRIRGSPSSSRAHSSRQAEQQSQSTCRSELRRLVWPVQFPHIATGTSARTLAAQRAALAAA